MAKQKQEVQFKVGDEVAQKFNRQVTGKIVEWLKYG